MGIREVDIIFIMNPLEVILRFDMTPMEAKAYKLCVLWDTLVRKEFPNEHYMRLKKKGDPRKSTLFRYCYKLARETKGLIPDPEYKLYITAQIHVLRLQNDGKIHALIDPHILVGDKAWRRWKLWKKYYDKQVVRAYTDEEIELKKKSELVLVELRRTKRFLEDQKATTLEEIKKKIDDLTFIRWVTVGKVSPYYAILSPLISSALDGNTLEEVFLFDLSVYHRSINEEVEEWFHQEFASEFAK